MLDMKTPFARSLSHLVMPNPNEIISLSPAQLVQIQFKIFHSTEAEERERKKGEGPPAEAIEVALQLRKEAKEEEGGGGE